MTGAIERFIEDARAVTVSEAAEIIGIRLTRANYAGPCPVCGGNDRFSISPAKQAWNCRQCGHGGRDGIGLIAHALEYNLSTRTGFLAACAEATGQPVPEGGEREPEEERQARIARNEERKQQNAEASAGTGSSDAFREKAINRARGIWLNAGPGAGTIAAEYLKLRCGFEMAADVFANVRFDPKHTYWHGTDERGFATDRHCGPAMILPFVNAAGKITGCHETWIDLTNAPKFRPDLGADNDNRPLPTKKMQGVKKGSFLPLFGLISSSRWVGGEGIENGLSIAGAEDFRADTFYFAAGDLGNLAGPAEPSSAFRHPTATRTDKNGRVSPVRVPGPVPKAGQAADEAMQLPDHVTQLVLLADGDSDFTFTCAAMARAEERFDREGQTMETWWPPQGLDFSKLMTG